MTATLDGVTKKETTEPTAEAKAAEGLVRRAREQGLSLTGPGPAEAADPGRSWRSPSAGEDAGPGQQAAHP